MNIRMILNGERERAAFAKRAQKYFDENPGVMTFTDGEIAPEKLFAIRWATKGATYPKRMAKLLELVIRGANLLEANTDKSSRRACANAIYGELAELGSDEVVSVLVFMVPHDAVLVGDLDVGGEG